jgi:uncharacterized membrane protein (DUF2068 family)
VLVLHSLFGRRDFHSLLKKGVLKVHSFHAPTMLKNPSTIELVITLGIALVLAQDILSEVEICAFWRLDQFGRCLAGVGGVVYAPLRCSLAGGCGIIVETAALFG